MADRIHVLDNPDNTGCLIHTGGLLEPHLRPHRVTENHGPEQYRPSRTIRGINGKIAKRTQNNGTAKEATGVAMSMTMQLHKKDILSRLINSSSTGDV
jgi:hypothetical protein